jgi:hypothetical protein
LLRRGSSRTPRSRRRQRDGAHPITASHRITFSTTTRDRLDPARVEGRRAVSLADRVDVMGGDLTIDSYPGMGTRIHATIPVALSEVR